MSSKVCMILVWFFVICLLVVGLVMVSSTAAWAEETKHPYEPLFKQTAFACAGLVGALVLSRIDYRLWRKYIWWILGLASFLLILCYVPGIGKEINGERRWITIGMQFQPSECAKLCMMMALAHWLALYRDRTTSFWWGFVMPGIIFGIPLALILFEKDMGTSVALALAAFCVMFVAGTRKIYLGAALIVAGASLYFLVQSNANRLERFLAWKDLDAHSQGAGLQQYRAAIALSRGGLEGVGLGNSAGKARHPPLCPHGLYLRPAWRGIRLLRNHGRASGLLPDDIRRHRRGHAVPGRLRAVPGRGNRGHHLLPGHAEHCGGNQCRAQLRAAASLHQLRGHQPCLYPGRTGNAHQHPEIFHRRTAQL